MLYAKDETGRLILAQEAHKDGHYRCPGCAQTLILRQGITKRSHFAHQRQQDCRIFSEGETEVHLGGKQLLLKWSQQAGFTAQLEAYLSDLKQRPDVLITRGGHQVALEFQCASLSVQKLIARSAGYQADGLDYFWFIGKNKNHPFSKQRRKLSQAVAKFLRYSDNLGFYLVFLNVGSKCFDLYYNIQQADCLPLSYMYQRVANLRELRNFMHRNLRFSFRTLNDGERSLQRRNYLRTVGRRQELANYCYLHHQTAQAANSLYVAPFYYPPIYVSDSCWWRAHCFLERMSSEMFLQEMHCHQTPFINQGRFWNLTWQLFQAELANLQFGA